ncbi:hypothetical protein [Bacillus sp. S/N-304-OC-R1]|uniref:hypothetical protein n=1 Tax=Bacillus sp. S/N-304-OC-R1 TaxID=2758034 RepID=UPI001C8E7BE1|nr:hypothetical protein [Bacillus sp. S/N-304-OC-R1]MBY0122173.1 hypothetical protein [Bacillus sp. S/N-304-OC-R1]
MNKNNEVQLNEIKEQMQNWILEQQLSNTENTLSDTIAFFSTTFAVVGIAVAILLVFAAWWMNKLFDSKLEKVREYSEATIKDKNEVESIKSEISNKLDNIKHLEESLQKAIEKLTHQKEISDFLEQENNYLKEQIELTLTLTRFQNIILKTENLLSKVNDDVVEKSQWASAFEDPLDQFMWEESSYSDAKNIYDHFINAEYKLNEYLGDVQAGEQGDRLEELKDELKNAQDFYEILTLILIE